MGKSLAELSAYADKMLEAMEIDYSEMDLCDLTLAYFDRFGSCWGTYYGDTQTDMRTEIIKCLESGKPQEKVEYKMRPGYTD